LDNNRGALAWWVSPENQKARLIQPYKPRTSDPAGWSDMAKTHSAPDPEPFGLDSLVSDPEDHNPDPANPKVAGRAITLATTELIVNSNPGNPQRSFHDLSTTATGLLTNTATGGWRKDMSIFTEKWNAVSPSPLANLPASGLPLFRILPEATSSVPKPTSEVARPTTTNPTASQSILYPWSAYGSPPSNAALIRNPTSTFYAEHNGAASSWLSLVNFITAYKDVSFNSGTGVSSTPLTWARTYKDTPWGPSGGNYSNTDLFNYMHKIQYGPILARVQWVFKLRSRRQSYVPSNGSYNRFDIDLLVSPVYTLWNPFNVTINVNERIGVAMNKSFPMAIGFGKGGGPIDYRRYINGSRFWTYAQGEYDSTLPGNYTNHWEQTNGQAARFPLNISLAPGEVKTFSLAGDAYAAQGGVIGELKAGYDGTKNYGYLSTSGSNPRRPSRILSNYTAADTVAIDMKFDNVTQLGPLANQKGPGIQLTLSRAHEPGAGNHNYLGDNGGFFLLTNN
jgi:hypothetical protein